MIHKNTEVHPLCSRTVLVAVMTVLFAEAVFATDAVWTDTTSSSANWTDASKWQDGSGQPLGTYPNGDYDVTLSPMADSKIQTINVGSATSFADFPRLDLTSLTGDASRTINLTVPVRKGKYAPAQTPFLVSIANPNGFKGFWTATEANAQFDFAHTGDFIPTLESVSASQRLFANVVNVGASAEIAELHGGGVLNKVGAGILHIRRGAGIANRVRLEGGFLALGDPDAPEAGSILKDAWLHLDASAEGTLLKEARGNRLYVTNWLDVRGVGHPYAKSASNMTTSYGGDKGPINDPFVSPVTSDTGLPLVDFGALYAGYEDVYGPSNCMLQLSASSSKIKEAFYVVSYTQHGNASPLGHTSDWQYYDFISGSGKMFGSSAAASVKNGDVAFNGEKCVYDYNPGDRAFSTLHVESVGLNGTGTVGAIATDRRYVGATGGMRIGEILLFTNALTRAERRAVNRYLLKRWKGETYDCDLGSVTITASGNTINVPAGAVAKVHCLNSEGANLVKTGAGTLKVDLLEPADTAIEVRDGNVELANGIVAVNDTEDAVVRANAYLWLDATASDSLEMDGETDFVSKWKDRRPTQTTQYARAQDTGDDARSYTGRKPYLAAGPSGKQVISFGSDAGGDTAWFLLQNRGYTACEGFMVFRVLTSGTDHFCFFGSSHTVFMRNWQRLFVHPSYTTGDAFAARWTLDGVEMSDPGMFVPGNKGWTDTTGWHVVSFAALDKLPADLIAKDRLDNTNGGNIEIGEYILFDRRLDAAEHRDVEAYLMKRWLGKDHPEKLAKANPGIGQMTFGSDSAAVFVSEADVTVGAFAGGNGAVVKTGSGAVRIVGSAAAGTKSVSVVGGALTVDYLDESGALPEPAWRFDASDLSTVEYSVGENGAVTNVTKWSDADGRAYTAKRDLTDGAGGKEIVYTNPVYRAAEGVLHPVLDFGKMSTIGEWAVKNPDSAGLRIYGANDGMPDNPFKKIREAHVIFADNVDSKAPNNRQTLFTSDQRGDYRYDYLRSGKTLFSGSAAAKVKDGYIAIDGTNVAYNAELPEGFHLVSVQPTDDTRISSIAVERTSSGGGCLVGEFVAYTAPQTERQRKFVQNSLMHKWFGTPVATWSQALDSIELAEGAAFSASGAVELSVGSISGAGSIAAMTVREVEDLSFTLDGSADWAGLVVDGALSLASGGTVHIVLADGVRKLAPGEYPLVTATTLEDVDLSGWTLEGTCGSGRTMRLVRRGDSIVLSVEPMGVILIVR